MKILVLMLIAAIVSILTKHFLARAARHSPVVGGEAGCTVILKYASTLKLAAVVFPATVFMLLAASLLEADPAHLESPLIAFSIILFIALVSAVVVLEAFYKEIILNQQGIQLIGKFGEVEIFWEEIESVTYHHGFKMFTVHAWDGRKLQVNPSLSGVENFESILQERLEPIRFRQALRGFRLRAQGLI